MIEWCGRASRWSAGYCVGAGGGWGGPAETTLVLLRSAPPPSRSASAVKLVLFF